MAGAFERPGAYLWRLLCKISTPPAFESYSWGPRQSYLALLTYSLLFVLRLISPLQWMKFRRRQLIELDKRSAHLASTIESKSRPDVHAADTERYLLGVFVFALAGYGIWLWVRAGGLSGTPAMARWAILGVQAVSGLFFLETVVWMLYYSLFRPLMERVKLNLYDEAEYFLLFPLVLMTQVLLLSVLWQKPFVRVSLVILNITDPVSAQGDSFTRLQAVFASLLWQGYLVIVIASLIRVLPELHVRKRPTITVIGYGDVVRERILPALIQVYEGRQIAVASDYLSGAERRQLREKFGVEQAYSALARRPEREQARASVVSSVAKWAEGHSKFAIVAVPTPYHLDYFLELSKREIRFALEKPVVSTTAELNLLERHSRAELWDRVFVFSYYWLEKGLTVNYLLSLNPVYRKMVEVSPDLPAQDLAYLFGRMGGLRRLEIDFLEGEEAPHRYWSELAHNGGMLLETLIHPMTFVVNFSRTCCGYRTGKELWNRPPQAEWRINEARASFVRQHYGCEIGPTWVALEGQLEGGAEVRIRCGKYCVAKGEEVRVLRAEFDHGWLESDLSRMETTLECGRAGEAMRRLTLRNCQQRTQVAQSAHGKAMRAKYQCQVDLLNTFFVDGWGGMRFDDYPSQLDVLRELLKLQEIMPGRDGWKSDEAN